MVFSAGGAAFEVGSHARHRGVRVAAGELEFDVAIEVLEALIAGQLRACWAKHALKSAGWSHRAEVTHVVSSTSPAMVLQRRENARGQIGRAPSVDEVQEGVEVCPAVLCKVSGQVSGETGAEEPPTSPLDDRIG